MRRKFGDIFDEIEADIDRMGAEADRFFRWAREKSKEAPGEGGPYVWGYSYSVGPDGQPHVERFGNVPAIAGGDPRGTREALESGAWEPFADVRVEEGQAAVTVDMPGVSKDDVKVKVRGDVIEIEAKGENRHYRKALAIGVPLDPESAKAKYNNGVLDLTVSIERPREPPGREVTVE